jgi:DNA-binding MarR family transcriptional regulator
METGGRLGADRRPIGYWLKHLDRLIEGTFERTLASEGLTRRHWQLLNTLHTRPSSPEIREALAPFFADDPGAERQVIDELVARAWVEPGQADLLELTAEGSRAHAALLERVAATRQMLLRDINEDEYRVVIDILRRMVDNLEQAAE